MTRIILLSAPVHLQPLAFSIQTIMIHVLGDVPSPPLAGWIHDHIFEPDDYVRPQTFPIPSSYTYSLRRKCVFHVIVCTPVVPSGVTAHMHAEVPE